jgi:hypothetical protein
MLKESIKSPIFTDRFRLIDWLCQSYPPHCVVLRLDLSEWLWKKSHREQPIVRLAMCERSSLGLPHTQKRMSGRPRVAEILLMRSPKTLRVRGDLKTRPKFVSHKSQREDGSGGEPEGRATASVACEPTAGISVRGCFTAAGQRAPARAARVAIGGGGRASLA